MNNIKDFYSNYLGSTEEIIAALKEDDFNKIDELISCREKLLRELESHGYKKESLSEEIDLGSILTLEQTIKNIIKNKEAEIEQKLSNLTKAKRANSLYYNANNSGAIVFNKKI